MGVFEQFDKALKAKGDAPIGIYKPHFLFYNLPRLIQRFGMFVMRFIHGQRKVASMATLKKFTKDEIDTVLRRKARFETRFKEIWDDLQLDGMLCPAFPHAAFRHEDSDELGFFAYYTMLFNVVGYPAGTIPVTEVLPGEDTPENYADAHNDIYTRKLKHSMTGSRGLPIGI